MPEEAPATAGPESPSTEGTGAAQQFVEDREYGSRHPRGWSRCLVPLLAAAWSLFQLSLPYCVILTETVVRTVHLAFAVALVFLSFSALKRPRSWLPRPLRFLAARDRLPAVDLVLAAVGSLAALYYLLDYEGIAARQGLPLARDLVVGVVLILVLLEAARRSLGPALSVIALGFIAYCFVNTLLPGIFAFGRVSLTKLISQQVLSTEGIYGVPLGVSASTVFLFVLFGMMLEKSGGGRFFVQLAFSLVGRFRGGPAKAAVLASGLTGLVSGSSIANVVTTGTFTIPLMKKSGYPPEKAAAVEVAASTNGQLMPPIMGAAAFIIAEYCNVPYLAVVKAAFIPAVISYLALIYITHLEACKMGLRPVPRQDMPRFLPTLLSGLHFLAPLGLLVFMLLYLRRTPEYAAFWAIVALAALIVIRDLVAARRSGGALGAALRGAGLKLWESLVAGGRSMMGIGVACAAAGVVIGVVNLGPGARITEMVEVLSGGSFAAVLVLTAVASLILGMGLPTTATYLVMASLTAPVIVKLGARMDVEVPPIAAHLFCFFFGILADDTPPVGLAAYAASAVAGSKPIPTGVQGFLYDLRTAILPFMFVFNTDLLLHGVVRWWRVVLIFGTSLTGMFSFAALTQRFTVERNRWGDSLMLTLSTLVLLRPQFLPGLLPGQPPEWLASRYPWYALGVALYAAVVFLQRRRRRDRVGGEQTAS